MTTSADRFGEDFGGEKMWGLQELALPEAIPYWPQTIGWYFIALILLLVIFWLCLKVWKQWQRNTYRRAALRQLSLIESGTGKLSELPLLLRSTALQAFPRHEVASLRNIEWTHWLNKSANSDIFTDAQAGIIAVLPYACEHDLTINKSDVNSIINASRYWIRNHRAAI